jgi:hypothetical protein
MKESLQCGCPISLKPVVVPEEEMADYCCQLSLSQFIHHHRRQHGLATSSIGSEPQETRPWRLYPLKVLLAGQKPLTGASNVRGGSLSE